MRHRHARCLIPCAAQRADDIRCLTHSTASRMGRTPYAATHNSASERHCLRVAAYCALPGDATLLLARAATRRHRAEPHHGLRQPHIDDHPFTLPTRRQAFHYLPTTHCWYAPLSAMYGLSLLVFAAVTRCGVNLVWRGDY